MEDQKQRVYDALNKMGIKYEVVEHEPVHTMEDMDRLGLPEKGTLCKNLFLRDSKGKRHFLITADEKMFLHGNVHLSFYASGFSLTNEKVSQAGILLILSSVLFNLINVWMEEGIFRGLFTKILEGLSYRKSLFFIAFLFGIWHLVMPLRDYLQGESSLVNLIAMGIGYVILAGMMSIKWSLLYKMTGSLWFGLGDHFFNNLASNLVHVVSNSEGDSLQIVRILLWQLLSFAIVLIIYRRKSKTIANQ